MAIIKFSTLRGSDLIVHEQEPSVAYTRSVDTVTLAANDVLEIGALVYRAKGIANAKWAPVKDAAVLVATNEVAVYLADKLGEFNTTTGVGDHVVALIVRGEIILKDKRIKDATARNGLTLTDAQMVTVKEIAKAQHIVIEKVLG